MKVVLFVTWVLSFLCAFCTGQGAPADPSNPEFYTVNAAQAYTWPRLDTLAGPGYTKDQFVICAELF